MNEITGLQSRDLSDHHGQQSIGRDIERHTQKDIATALVKLTRQFAVGHIELEQAMTRRQCHLIDVGDIPRRDNMAA